MFSTAATFLSEDKTPIISASSYCVMLTNSKKVLLSNKMDAKRQVASLTKLMTAMTVTYICKQYSVDITTTLVKIDHESALIEGTSAGLKYGDELTVMDLLHGMLLPSGNDAATALASHFGKLTTSRISTICIIRMTRLKCLCFS
jgi:D-alanyl-D-alanine carboxypeptidase (penicillin-binding protein 5/6)